MKEGGTVDGNHDQGQRHAELDGARNAISK